MKKLMIATALATFCGAVGVNALESANTVGYQGIEAPTGSSMRAPTFKTVGGSGYDLTAIKVVGADGTGDVCGQTISAEGEWDGEYYYLTMDGSGVEDGWYKDIGGAEAVEADEVVLAPGEALFVDSQFYDLVFTLPAVLSAN